MSQLDDWVLCRVRQKGNMPKNTCEGQDSPNTELISYLPKIEEQHSIQTKHIDMDTDHLYNHYQLIASMFAGHPLPHIEGSNDINGYGSVREDDSDKLNLPITVSSFDNFFNPQKGNSEKNRYENPPLSQEMLTSGNENENLSPHKTLASDRMSFHNQSQSQVNINSTPQTMIYMPFKVSHGS